MWNTHGLLKVILVALYLPWTTWARSKVDKQQKKLFFQGTSCTFLRAQCVVCTVALFQEQKLPSLNITRKPKPKGHDKLRNPQGVQICEFSIK